MGYIVVTLITSVNITVMAKPKQRPIITLLIRCSLLIIGVQPTKDTTMKVMDTSLVAIITHGYNTNNDNRR
jgi:hypothetical protein